MSYKITKISFGESVKKLSYDEFMARFQPIFPDADLKAYANDLGIMPTIPAGKPNGTGRKSGLVNKKSHDEDITASEQDQADKRANAGQGEHEADEEGLH